ncbi:hypothetical protein QWA68_005042 [Fusarium oxysporum]|nr:hypothetical protein QWA68_005042 [Fusarium oxysporum]
MLMFSLNVMVVQRNFYWTPLSVTHKRTRKGMMRTNRVLILMISSLIKERDLLFSFMILQESERHQRLKPSPWARAKHCSQ